MQDLFLFHDGKCAFPDFPLLQKEMQARIFLHPVRMGRSVRPHRRTDAPAFYSFIHMPDVEFSLFLQRKLPHTPDPILFCNPGHNLKFVPTFSRKFRIQNFPHTFTPFSPLQSERNWKKPETDRTSGFRQMLCLRQKV